MTQVLTAPFRALFNGLIALAEAGPRMKQVRKLNALSDEELAARGTTRVEEVRRIFGDQMYI
ncbi:DUF1127 domain-containing protein [Paracoccus tegillarcae]|uniref:DUF1127 domain-containing protein n=1 Tax=Paracoccus tegillarcae TaxID=1529068 RepID=A0A2K9EX01_9RHOB|nr:DUF1127 domain-containing protein [Paracoccus tegillarcae]